MRRTITLAFTLLLAAAARPAPGSEPLVHLDFDDGVRGGADTKIDGAVVGAAGFTPNRDGRALNLPPGAAELPFVDLGDAAALRFGPDRDFTVAAWLRTEAAAPATRVVLSNKDSRDGKNRGWMLAVAPSGAWSWNVGDGDRRFDYEPTARQTVADGRWHHVAFSVSRARREARLYRDGVNVAVYSIAGLGDLTSGLPTRIGADGTRGASGAGFTGAVDEIRIWGRALADGEVESAYRAWFPMPARPERVPEHIKIMAWNIWHGGREDGAEIGVERTIEAIRAAGADIVCMQETYGSGPRIADALGFRFYLRSSNLSIMTRFRIGETYDLFEPFRFGGARIVLSDGRHLDVFSLWIHYLPDYWGEPPGPETTAQQLVEGERATRTAEITDILEALAPLLARRDGVPVVVAGDFNSHSHLDWTEATAAVHHGLVVPWAVSRAMAAAGFTDAYRAIHPDPRHAPGYTWSPRFTEQAPGRIDYVYARGDALSLTGAVVTDQHPVRWPSDHAAVVATYRLQHPTPGP